MTNSNNINKSDVKNELILFFEKLDFEITDYKIDLIKAEKSSFPLIKIILIIENPEILIGEGGATLIKIQRILKMILRKKIVPFGMHFYLNLDINGYKEKKEELIKSMSEKFAEEVILSGQEKLLEIMPSFERRIVHLALKDNDKIITESISQGKDKRVLIKLKSIHPEGCMPFKPKI